MIDLDIPALAELLQHVLGAPVAMEDDFVRLASAGEPLRRALSLVDGPHDAQAVADAYEVAIASYAGTVPSTLTDDATAVAEDLLAFAERPADQREPSEALALILELEAIVSTVVAAERTRRVREGTADELSARLEDALVGISDRSVEIAQQAEDRWLTTGHDPEIPGAFGWLDTLAVAAPSRTRIRNIAEAAAERERRVEEAMAILAAPRPQARVRGLLENLPPTFLVPRFVQHANFATPVTAWPKQTVLAESDELSIFVEDTAQGPELVVAFGPPLSVDGVEAFVDGVKLTAEMSGARDFRFRLPHEGERVRIDVRIGDDHISHELQLRHEP